MAGRMINVVAPMIAITTNISLIEKPEALEDDR
jgi:hypothetical protein